MVRFRRAGIALAVLVSLAGAGSAQAGWLHGHFGCGRYLDSCGWHASVCAPSCLAPCAPEDLRPCVTKSWSCEPVYATVPRTTYTPYYEVVPTTVTKTCYRTETRQRPVTTYRLVPETHQVTRAYTVMIPETHSAVRNVPHVRYATETVERTYSVAIPQTEMRTAYRTACKTHYETAYRSVCRNVGHWEESCEFVSRLVYPRATVSTCAVPSCCATRVGHYGGGHLGCLLGWRHACGLGCGVPCGPVCAPVVCEPVVCEPIECGNWVTRRTWVPETIWEQVPYTVCKYEYYQVPYEYPVTTYRYETRSRTVPVTRAYTEYVPQTYTYTAYRPETRTRTHNVVSHRRVEETHMQTYAVSIPYPVTETVDRIVCKMIPQTSYECVLTGYRMVACEVTATTCATCP